MKKIILTAFIYTTIILNALAQDTNLLDQKKGFKDIKIGNHISILREKVEVDDKNDTFYNVTEEYRKSYYVGNNVISDIMIAVDNKKSIQGIFLSFRKFKHLITDAKKELKDKTLSPEKRETKEALLKYMIETPEAYDFYFKLFKDAFGEPIIANRNYEWHGKHISLITDIKNNRIIFTGENILETYQSSKQTKAQKAASKF